MRGDNSTSEIPYKQHIEDLNGEITHLQNAVKNNTGDIYLQKYHTKQDIKELIRRYVTCGV